MAKRIGIFLLSAVIGALCLDAIGRFLPAAASGFVATVEATVGRPLTPVSAAGVARRTARRCEGDHC